jgi:hypothetical protein
MPATRADNQSDSEHQEHFGTIGDYHNTHPFPEVGYWENRTTDKLHRRDAECAEKGYKCLNKNFNQSTKKKIQTCFYRNR